jgi:hypothetical protein
VLLAVQIGFALAFAPCEALADSAVPVAPAGKAITATDTAAELPPSEEPAATAGAGDNPATEPAPGAATGGPPAPDTGTEPAPGAATGGPSAPDTGTGEEPESGTRPEPSESDGSASAPNPAEQPCAASPPAGGGTPAAAEHPCPAPASAQPAAAQPGAEPPDGHAAGESTSTPRATPDAPAEPRAHRPVAAPRDVAPLPYIAAGAPDRTARPPRARRRGHAGPSPSAVDRPTPRALAPLAGSAWLTSVAAAPPDRVIVSLGRRARAGSGEGDGRHAGRERPPRLDPQPTRHSPTAPPLERTAAAASAAGSSGSAQQALSCVMFLLLAVSAAHELRRFRFRMLVPVAPGAPSLRDRPG